MKGLAKIWLPAVTLAVLLPGVTAVVDVAAQQAQSVTAAIRSYTGELRILRSYGDRGSARFELRRTEMGGDCDAAVEVRSATYFDGRARFILEHVGRLNVGGRVPLCGNLPRQTTLTITHIDPEETAEVVKEVLARFLMTPEDYLAERGIGFEVSRDSGGRSVVQQSFAGQAPRLHGSGGDCWLVVYPGRPRSARGLRDDDRVMVEATLGADATFHDPRILSSPGPKFGAAALRALSLWRCEPTFRDGQPGTITLEVPVSFRKD
jgi:TonB family protein